VGRWQSGTERHEREETHQGRCPNNGREVARRFKQGWPSSSWPSSSSSSTGPSNGAREREDLRSATGHSVTPTLFPPLLIHSILNIYFIFSCGGLQTTPPPDLKLCGRTQTKRSAGRAVDCQHQTSYGVRHSGIRNTAPSLPQSPFSRPDSVLASQTPTSSVARQR